MVEGAALEKQCAGNGTEGSNPSLSAIITIGRDEWVFWALAVRHRASGL